ncbi:MAG: lamin tail domain-containing protein [Chitinophagaceae bacterium]|nr:lamin tail domain-containing protein [Chitinophagaceae bacterium]HRA12148.1 lamin tail domain-containing protein [Chitinophagaceae bacterium]
MIKKILSLFLLAVLVFSKPGNAQFIDSFTDGNFSANPAWSGNTADWIVNPSLQLQSNNNVASSNFYLSTANTLATTAQWEFWCQITFNPSSTNYIDFYLTASVSDITQSAVTGYFVRIGGTSDEISLYRKNANGTSTLIIDGLDGTLNSSSNTMKIRVIRDASNQWTLLRDLTGTGNTYSSEGSVVDATFTTSAFFGIWVRQSTASFFQRHFFDDFEVKTYVPDVTAPAIQTLTALSPNTLDVLFNEPVSVATSQTLSNYTVTNGIGNPTTAVRDVTNNALVHLTFTNSFPNGISNTITINGVQDLSNNAIVNGTGTFSFYTAQRYDIVIDELVADPTPVVGLPDNEWIELKNTTTFPINLQGWKISDATGTSGTMPNFILQPNGYVIVCTGSAVAAMSALGSTITVTSFPSLDNNGEILSLSDASGKVIHALTYDISWYQNELKKDGGWSLEMIDTKNPCTGGSNWKASTDATGGTPGKKNSIDAVNNDQTAPKLKRAYTINATTIVAVFNEPVDSLKGATVANYTFSNGLTIVSAISLAPLFNEVQLTLSGAMQAGTVYTLTAANITDCKGNTIGTDNKAKVGLPVDAAALDMIVNEILFNPRSNAYDFVEFYNKSNKIFDASKLFIANRNSSNVISSIGSLTTIPWLVFPGDYIVLTEDAASLSREYLVTNPDWVFTKSSLPSFPDDKGFVLLLNQQGDVIDEVNYDKSWHFKLIDNEDGVSLERIDPVGSSQEPTNWHSAASTAGYGTPTYKNSQYKLINSVNATIEVVPKVFSPDNDGRDDIATVQYQVTEPGFIANITIFDAAGRPIRNLIRNGTLGLQGYWNWDGLDDKGNKLPVGTYIVFSEIFNLQGKKEKFKNVVVLARKL